MIDEIRRRLIESEISPQDLRIVLAIIDELEKEQEVKRKHLVSKT